MDYEVLNKSLSSLRFKYRRHELKVPNRDAFFQRTTEAGIPPNADIRLSCKRFGTRNDRLKTLALLSWLLTETDRFYLHENIREQLEYISEERRYQIELMLSSKASCIQLYSKMLSERDWFGNYKKLLEKLYESLKYRFVLPKRPRRQIRRRGYTRNSGRPLEEKSTRWSPDRVPDTKEQNRIELERQAQLDAIEFMRGFLE